MHNDRRPQVRRMFTLGIAFALALGGVLISLASLPAAAQPFVIGSGGSDELTPPPSPACDDLVFVTEVSFDPAGNPIDIPRFGTISGMVLSYDVPGFSVGPGILALNEVITYDGHVDRDIQGAQTAEQVRFELLLDGVVQASTPLTPDVPDGQLTGWIDVDMGTYELPNGADTLRIIHSGNTASPNSVVVSALCGEILAPPETVPPVTEPPASVPPTTTPATVPSSLPPATSTAPIVPETTLPPTTTPPSTVTPTTAAPATTVAPTSTTTPPPASTSAPQEPSPTTTVAQPALAVTGTESAPLALIGGALLTVGTTMLLAAKRLRTDRK